MKKFFYTILKFWVTLGLRLYFNKIEINGKENIPSENTAVIYAPNHQGAFLDALIIAGFAKRPIFSLARASVFVKPYLWFLEALNMMPVYRIRDGFAKLSKNEAIFEACKKILHKRKALLIFPEAAHHREHYLHPLSKGLVRIALDSQKDFQEEIKVLPVGINYYRHFYPRHKLCLNYGKPIGLKSYMDQYKQQRALALNALREDLSNGIKDSLIITSAENYEQSIHVFSRKNESLNFNEMKELVNSENFEKEKHFPFIRYISEPLMIFNFPLHLINHYVMNNMVKEVEFYGSLKFAFGLLLFPLWCLLSFILFSIFFSFKLAIAFLLIQILALFIRQELLRYTH